MGRAIAWCQQAYPVTGWQSGEVKALTMEHAKSMREKIDDLIRMETTLLDVASRCSGDAVSDCPILDALSDAQIEPNKS